MTTRDRAIIAATRAWCCPDGCPYVEAGRDAECDASDINGFAATKMRQCIAAYDKQRRASWIAKFMDWRKL